ncbi:hypothetical protein LY474_33115 [Myxococcus stipitatus]|uniref:hypothetical protein n=1 Tax=Myxococcus stipitatus TaxID=83455 RepID=UPI001F1A3F3C|nr:hypothetical protein [Myxococcus stipitatus]MCE9672660.1 hypothetical protein [Myxococcus stipitatus]
MTLHVFKLVTLVVSLSFVSSASWAQAPRCPAAEAGESAPAAAACPDPADVLASAARAAGVSLNLEQLATATTEGALLVGTSIAGFEQVPATRFPQGVDVGFVYLDVPASAIPVGYYRVNVTADAKDVRVGTYPGVARFFGLDGGEVASVEVSIETSTLSVPVPLPFPRTLFEIRAGYERGGLTGNFKQKKMLTYFCPNGSVIHIPVREGLE